GLVIHDSTWTYKIPTVDTIPKQFNVELINSARVHKRVLSSKASGEAAAAAGVVGALRDEGGDQSGRPGRSSPAPAARR
ncbi:Os03g0791200, partial [Oryza sativa Japonica Group]